MNLPKKIFHELDGIRVLAISMVVLVHFMPVDRYPYVTWWQGIGVTFFFQIGVFLATLNLIRLCQKADSERISLRSLWLRFMLRRWLRLSPLVFALILCLYSLGLIEARWSLIWHATLTSNLYFALIETSERFFDHLWFLGAHEQFLAFWAGIVIARPRISLRAILWLLLLAGLLFRIAIGTMVEDVGRLDALFPGQLVPLSLGGLLAMRVLDEAAGKQQESSYFELAFLLLGVAGYLGLRTWPEVFSEPTTYVLRPLCDSMVCYLVLKWMIFGRQTATHRLLSSRFAGVLSNLSYGVYVWHLASIAIVIRIATWLGYPLSYAMERLSVYVPSAEDALVPHSPQNIGLMSIVSIILAMISLILIEKPISRITKRFQVVPNRHEPLSSSPRVTVVSGNQGD